MILVEIVNPTRQELYDKAVAAVKALTVDGPPSDTDDKLADISFYLMACPPPEEHKD